MSSALMLSIPKKLTCKFWFFLLKKTWLETKYGRVEWWVCINLIAYDKEEEEESKKRKKDMEEFQCGGGVKKKMSFV